jgi:hypothetical protein
LIDDAKIHVLKHENGTYGVKLKGGYESLTFG